MIKKLPKFDLNVETLKLTGWIAEKHLRNVRILTSKPTKGKFVEIVCEFVPIKMKHNKEA